MEYSREQTLETILERTERRESQRRRRAILYTLIPIMMALILLVYSSTRIQKETNQVMALQREAAQYEQQIQGLKKIETKYKTRVDELSTLSAQHAAQAKELETRILFLKKELDLSEQRLKSAVKLSQYTHPIDFTDLKTIFSRYPRQSKALELILRLRQRNVGWHLGGQTPDIGFDSPSFAMYVLNKLELPIGRLRSGESILSASRQLFHRLQRVSSPNVGDLVFYPAGYVLFYFRDENNKPFVIGMTPTGITALKPNFSRPVGYGRSGL